MGRAIKFIFCLLLFCQASAQTNYYVTGTSSSGNGSGSSEGNAMALTTAFSTAVSGDTIMVKSGTYALSDQISLNNAGVVVLGYQTTPGDIQTAPYAGLTYSNGMVTDGVRPQFDFDADGDTRKTGVRINADNVKFHNIGFQNAGSCIDITSSSSGVLVDNCEMWITDDGVIKYNSFAVRIYGDNNLVQNSFALNQEFAGFYVYQGDNNTVRHCAVYADAPAPPGGGTDYYFMTANYQLAASCDGNLFEYNIAARKASIQHPGRGIDNKGGTNTIWRYNYIENTAIEVDFATSTDVRIYGNTVVETQPELNYNRTHFELQSGPERIYFYGNIIYNQGRHPAIQLTHSDDGASSDPAVENSTTDDIYIFSNVFVGTENLVDGFSNASNGYNHTVTNFKFWNNTVVNCRTMFNVGGGTTLSGTVNNNIFINNTGSWASANTTVTGSNNNFYSNNFSTQLTAPLSLNPLFTGGLDSEPGSYELQPGSPMINAGTALTFPYPFDMNLGTRVLNGTVEIGAFEFGSVDGGGGSQTPETPTPPTAPSSGNKFFKKIHS